ncbi:MAG: prephenate dehydrogenase [Atopobiaceae bacterium]|nr:prephenate dehydrogenase [Atopobiaceae bacterium]
MNKQATTQNVSVPWERPADASYVPGRVGVVGLGLIGGSFAKAFAAAGNKAYACNRSASTIQLALVETIAGVLDEQTIPSCELIILSLYPEANVAWLERHAELISPGAIVIDTAGTKRGICDRCFELAGVHPFQFCGGHPMAGTHHSGFGHATADLFSGAPMVLVPPPLTDIERLVLLDRIKTLLAPCKFGSYSQTTANNHDRIIAFSSQLAHVVSNAYIKSPTRSDHQGFSAGSYRDLTRVAKLNPQMWTELFLDNADNLIFEIDQIIAELTQYREALAEGDAQTLCELLAEGDRLKREDMQRENHIS